jgi:hypothetical protein
LSLLISHSYTNRLLQGMQASSTHFQQCAKVLNSIPVMRLKRPRNLAVLPEVIGLLEEDMSRSSISP